MVRRWFVLVFACVLVTRPMVTDACLWDYDTAREESLGQPEVAAILRGDLSKHSQTYYTAKVEYTRLEPAKYKHLTKATASHPARLRPDNLAVALAKLGRVDEAIEVITAKDAQFPGMYTTEANLGTFLAMKGDLKGALEHLNKAIAINPDAHFGREKYQIQLLEYLQRVATDPTLPTRENFLGIDQGVTAGQSTTIMKVSGRSKTKRSKAAAPSTPVLAIVGLIRFGDGDSSPHLWHALGWALVDQGDAQLAVRAFRRAELLGHPRARDDGAVVATTLKEAKEGCCPAPDAPAAARAWATLSTTADAEWKRGQAAERKRQTAEDAKLAKKQFRAVFGY